MGLAFLSDARFLAVAIALAAALIAPAPLMLDGYWLALLINILSYVVLATAWAMFSGPTRYVSLCTVAFFGVGAYTVALFGETLPWLLVLAIALAAGTALSLIVGLATLRLSGVYFVIFTFGLAELIRQLVTWFEVNVTRTLGRYVFVDMPPNWIYWQLLALAALVLLTGLAISRSRIGLALRMIGEDEEVARHCGVDAVKVKLLLFSLSATFMTLTGAVMATRWSYIDPAIAFNPVISFQVLIMALLGGATKLFGPLVGVIPLALLFEVLTANFPNYFSLLLGATFMVIVYLAPRGVLDLIGRRRNAPRADAAEATP